MSSRLDQVVKHLKYENLPIRKDATIEAIPIRLTQNVPAGVDIEHLKAAIRLRSLASLINYKDVCVHPVQCRFFSLYGSNESYFMTSKRVTFGPYYAPSRAQSLFIIKDCALKVKGFRGINPNCPFKSVRELCFDQTRNKRSSSCFGKSWE